MTVLTHGHLLRTVELFDVELVWWRVALQGPWGTCDDSFQRDISEVDSQAVTAQAAPGGCLVLTLFSLDCLPFFWTRRQIFVVYAEEGASFIWTN